MLVLPRLWCGEGVLPCEVGLPRACFRGGLEDALSPECNRCPVAPPLSAPPPLSVLYPFLGAQGWWGPCSPASSSALPCPPLQGGDPDGLFAEANVMACVLDMVMAGTETTSATLQWAALLMGKHPGVQGECRPVLGPLALGGVPWGQGQVSPRDAATLPVACRPGAAGAGPRVGAQAATPAGGPAVTALHQCRAA